MMMRTLWTMVLLVWMWNTQAQVLVVAGGHTPEAKTRARELIKAVSDKNWNREKWQTQCRKQGFACVGNEQVIYLVPLHSPSEFAEQCLNPLYEYLSNVPERGVLSRNLPPHLLQYLLRVFENPSLQTQLYIPIKDFLQMLRAGNVWIEVGDLGIFEIERPDGLPRFLIAQRDNPQRPNLTALLKPAREELETGDSAVNLQLSTPKASKDNAEWWFLFSSPISFDLQVEHIQAYIKWLQVVRSQAKRELQQVNMQIWNLLYDSLTPLQGGTVYNVADLPTPVREALLKTYGSKPGTSEIDENSKVVFREWRVGLLVAYRVNPIVTQIGVICIRDLIGLED
jgi:hypothetical protein